jgi:hypothetical protein
MVCLVDISELQSLQKGFKEVDKDKSGDLDFAEFKALMKKELKTEMTEDSLQVLSMGKGPNWVDKRNSNAENTESDLSCVCLSLVTFFLGLVLCL